MTGDIRVLDLFSGLGGFSLGLEMASPRFRTVLFCEADPFRRARLARHWPEVPCHDDVRTLTAALVAAVGPVHLVCGGFPCVDIAAPGRGAGIEGERSGLWRDMARIIGGCRPDWVLAENSPFLRVRGADRVLGDLEAHGYACWPLVVGAGDIGADHIRKRTFVVAHADRARLEIAVARTQGELAPPVGARPWAAEPAMDRVAYGVPHRVERVKALGDAVVPQVVAMFGRWIAMVEAADA